MTQMQQKILALVTERDHVTWVELSERIDGFGGDFEFRMSDPKVDNIVLWSGVSKEAGETIQELLRNGTITMLPTGVITYLIDGGGLRYPVAKRVRRYTKPRWLPIVFRPGQSPDQPRCAWQM